MDWVTIDFEASCLPRHGRSYPIEVGVCGPLGSRSWLIRPTPEWQGWDWTHEAAGLHGITRRQLDEQGLAPETVIAEVRRAVGSARVVADSSIDRIWWQALLDAGSPTGATPLVIEHIRDVFDEIGATAAQIKLAQQRADWLCPARHRAGADARWLFTLLSTLTQQADTLSPINIAKKIAA